MACAQIANSWGQKVDKLDFEGRRQFVRSNLEAVLDSAERPLDGHRSASFFTKISVDPSLLHLMSNS